MEIKAWHEIQESIRQEEQSWRCKHWTMEINKIPYLLNKFCADDIYNAQENRPDHGHKFDHATMDGCQCYQHIKLWDQRKQVTFALCNIINW